MAGWIVQLGFFMTTAQVTVGVNTSQDARHASRALTGLTSGGVVALSRVGCNYGWFVWDCSRVDDPVDSPPGNNVRSRPSCQADRRTITTFMSNNPRDNQSRSSNNPQTIFSLLSSTRPQASVTTLLSSDNTQGSKPACGTTHDSHDDLVDSST